MTREEKLAYAKGYAAGSRGSWPAHKPPMPPTELVALMMTAARELRNSVDAQLCLFDKDDDIVLAIGPKVDVFDQAMIAVTDWLRNPRNPGDAV